jgi:phospholipid/cholesterol/gamma-HCH transport system substrate-binding protein
MAKPQDTTRNIRIGVVVALSLAALMAFLFFIGSEQKMFSRKNEYRVLLESVSGLAEGNPVQMSGVTIGAVRDIALPSDPKNQTVTIWIVIQQKYAERVRTDSRAKLRKLGLIAADSYIDITPGSPQYPTMQPGSIILAQKATDVDKLISSGEDLVANLVQISYSLKNVLARVDRGEGLIGELTTDPAKKQRITDTMLVTLNKTNEVLGRVQSGKGLIGKLVYDDAYSEQLTGSIDASAASLRSIMASMQTNFESGQGALPALLSDPAGKKEVNSLLVNLRVASENVVALSEGMKNGEGIVPRLMNDREYADETLKEFQTLVQRLGETARKLNDGEGTAGRLISDPAIYESINDILIGINESKLLRWLVRNRQASGIETRYKAATGKKELSPAEKRETGEDPTPPVVPPPDVIEPQAAPVTEPAPPAPVTDTTTTAVPPPAETP